MTTITQPKIQKLESREDLELLVEGDIVEVKFNGHGGKDNDLGSYEGPVLSYLVDSVAYSFIRRGEGKIISYLFSKKNIEKRLSVNGGKLFQIGRPLSIREDTIGTADYNNFDKILREAGL